MALVYSRVPISCDSVMVSWHAQCQVPEAEAAKWNQAVIHFIIFTCVFSTVEPLLPSRHR